MNVAREAAPEIDRLVWAVSRGVNEKHAARLRELAHERGLDSLELIAPLGDFLLAGELTRQMATMRVRYQPQTNVLGRLDELEQGKFIRPTGSGLVATEALQPLLLAIIDAEADVAAEQWAEHTADVSTASDLARQVGLAASDDHVVAVAHRALPEPTDPFQLLYHRLVTLRYVRQHAHAEAWLAHSLTAPAIVVMTKLWQGDDVDTPSDALAQLVERGFATDDPPALTATGREVREAIEKKTNERAQASFDVLDDEAAASFLGALRRLPGTPSPPSR